MTVLVVAVILALLQSPSSVPQKASDSPGRQSDAASNKVPAGQSAPAINASPTQQEQTKNGAESRDTQQPITVKELPPLTIAKDWADRAYWIFGGVLVIVGIFQVWLLAGTLRTTNRQAEIAEKQETQMVLAGEQTERIINQMRDTAQRQLRAYICINSTLLKFLRSDVPEIQVHIKNLGQTPAYDVRGWIHMWIEEYPLTITLPEPPEGFPTSKEILGPTSTRVYVVAKKPPIPSQSLPLLGTTKGTIYVYGEVRYKDAFGSERYTKYRFIYGGSEGVRMSKPTAEGLVTALLKPDAEGNEAS